MTRIYLVLFAWLFTSSDFRTDQKAFPRVKRAYETSEQNAKKLFTSKGLHISNAEILIIVHKLEKELLLYAREKGTLEYNLLKGYSVCNVSGEPGPKRAMGDLQTPEGFYHINRFNPSSSYHLSLGINYPNSCDLFHSKGSNAGGDIFIHGKCVTIGCLPMTDPVIEELYVIAVEARNAGQKKIPVAIFPCRMDSPAYLKLKLAAPENVTFWENIKTGYDHFKKHSSFPLIREVEGSYLFN